MTTRYTKPHLSVDQQIELLRSRGPTIDDCQLASHWLRMVGYYRLSGYWYPYRALVQGSPSRENYFIAGTSFEQITNLYDFDRRLKLLALDAIERVEISMRFRVGYTLGRRGAYAHLDPIHLDASFDGSRPGKPVSRYTEWSTLLFERIANE